MQLQLPALLASVSNEQSDKTLAVELNLGNVSAMGTGIALYGEWLQVNTGFEVRAVCKLVYIHKEKSSQIVTELSGKVLAVWEQ